MKKSLGQHLTIDFYNCNATTIDDVNKITTILEKGAEIMNLSVVKTMIHEFSPIGISGVVVIEESHIAIHTWPEYQFVALDFFTCNNSNSLDEGIEWIQKQLQANYIEKNSFSRGYIDKIKAKNVFKR